MKILQTESFGDTFGGKAKRKKPKLEMMDVETMINTAVTKQEAYDPEKDSNIKREQEVFLASHPMFKKGQSNRIWTELYKVIDCSDVVVQVLDARDPVGTRSDHVEQYLKKHTRHKNLILVLNKCDLVPTWVTRRWVNILSQQYPTIAFHASISNPFGKGSLIQLLKQLGQLHNDKKQISVGFIGYPNVGKSSIINTLKKERVCKAAPIPGETRVWQYVTLFRNVYLIDSPGVVYDTGDNETSVVLKGVVRIESLKEPAAYIPEVLERVKRDHLVNTYGVSNWEDEVDFLTQIAKKSGRLHKGGEADISTIARRVLSDWQRGKIPWFVLPPVKDAVVQQPNLQTAEEKKNDTTATKIKQMFSKIEVCAELAGEKGEEEEVEHIMDGTDWDVVYADGIQETEMLDDAGDVADENAESSKASVVKSELLDEQAMEEDKFNSILLDETPEAASSVPPPVNFGKRKEPRFEDIQGPLKKSKLNPLMEKTLGGVKISAKIAKKLKKDMLKQQAVENAAATSGARFDSLINHRLIPDRPDLSETSGDKRFRILKGVKDVKKLNTDRLKPSAPIQKKGLEKSQKRYSMNRRLTRLCL